MNPDRHERLNTGALNEAYISLAGEQSVIERAFPALPFARREAVGGDICTIVDAEYGDGARYINCLPDDMSVVFADFSYRNEVSAPGIGQDFLKFHYKLNGRNVVKFANRPDTLIETGRNIIAYHPEGLCKDDCFAADVREVSLTIGCRRNSILNLLGVSSDELPKPVRRYFDCHDSDFLCDELPLTPRMRNASAEMNRPAFSPWLQKIHLEAKVLDLICMSFHELANQDNFSAASVALKARDIEMLHAVRQSLDESFAKDIAIPNLCRKFATNRSKLSEGFRALFGTTIFEYIHSLRMQHAQLLLNETDIPIWEIAEQVGYSRQSSFSTAFREHFKIRPLDVRKGRSVLN